MDESLKIYSAARIFENYVGKLVITIHLLSLDVPVAEYYNNYLQILVQHSLLHLIRNYLCDMGY